MAKTRKAVTNVDKFVRDKDVNAFMEKQRQSEVVSDFARQHPEQQEKIMRLSRYQYQLEQTLASIQPIQDRPLNDICDEFGTTPWPELKLYSGDNGRLVQPLKPHQVDGKLSPICKLRARPRGTVWDY